MKSKIWSKNQKSEDTPNGSSSFLPTSLKKSKLFSPSFVNGLSILSENPTNLTQAK